jgi:hypothetical protein
MSPPDAPEIGALDVTSATPGAAVEISGRNFGSGRAEPRVVFQLQLPSAPEAAADVTTWAPTRIVAEVPSLDLLGSGGSASILVETRAGRSEPFDFTVLEPSPPAITSVRPSAALPGDELEITGKGFGLAPFGGAVVIGSPDGTEVSIEGPSWSASEIRATVPALDALGDRGSKSLSVRTLWGTSAPTTLTIGEDPKLSALPVLMLPARIETRYAAGGSALRVRIFPDECAIDTHEPPLTTEELEAARAYRAADPERRNVLWPDLVGRFGVGRATWLAHVPLDDANDPDTRDASWTRAPRTRVMPDRWYAFGYKRDDEGRPTRVFSEAGRNIPDDLAVGPDPRALGVALSRDVAPADEGMKWLVDFKAALDCGMALHITLPPEARGRLDRLIVLGVKSVPGPTGADERIAEMLAAQRYTRGLGFVDDGTPSNNTRSVASGFDSRVVPPPVDPGNASVIPADGSHRTETAKALGLGEQVFADVANEDGGKATRDGRRAMNTALWPSTWGYFLEQIFTPALNAEAIADVRAHFLDYVRASGPLPLLRIGPQPYGIHLATPLTRWQAGWRTGERDAPTRLVRLLNDLRGVWRRSLAAVPRVDPTAGSENLLATLAMQPTSVAYKGRSVLGDRYVRAAWEFIRLPLPADWAQEPSTGPRELLARLGITSDPDIARATFASSAFSFDGPAVERDPDGGGAAKLRANYLQWLSRPTPPGYRSVRDESFPEVAQALPPPRPLLYLLVRHGLLLEYVAASANGFAWREDELVGVDEIDDDLNAERPPTPWDRLAADGKGRLLDVTDPSNPEAFRRGERTLGAYRAALAALEPLPVRTLERLLAETLDLCTHRLDAWVTSIAARRLTAVRQGTGSTGLHLAGWGAVIDLAPDEDARESRGFVHAPSQTHATAAAMLANGYLTHRPHLGRHPFAIELTSSRVRLALWLLDGVRRGQPLGALLGYRFERGLHERRSPPQPPLDVYVDDFRRFAPLPTGSADETSDAARAIAARNVVDGLELQRRWAAAGRELPAEDWPEIRDEDQADVTAELNALDDAVDAVADLLTAESVFQAARGNPARAAAALDAAAGKGPPPPELEVAQTPRSGLSISHRLLLLLPEAPLPRSDWAASRTPEEEAPPRATAEPRLEAWAARLLGSPKRITCEVEYVDPESGDVRATKTFRLHELQPALSALDVVYAAEAHDTPQRSELEQRFLFHAARNRPAGVPANAIVRLSAAGPSDRKKDIALGELMEAARALREVIAGARPISHVDLSAPELPNTATLRPEIETRAADALATLRSARDALESALPSSPEDLRAALHGAARFGVPGAVPNSALGDGEAERSTLRAQGETVLAELKRRAATAEQLPTPENDADARRDRAVAVLATVFGPAFRTLPIFSLDAPPDEMRLDVSFDDSGALTAGDVLATTLWLQRAARVRDGARRFLDALTYSEAIVGEDQARLEVAQLPAKPGDRWIALPFAGPRDFPAGRLSFAASLPFGAPAAGQALAGLLLDEWREVIPSAEETTALGFHFDAPDPTAPQTLILAVPPRPEDWTLDTLEETVLQTLELAQARMVDVDALKEVGQFLPAIHLAMNVRGATVATDLKAGTGQAIA